ncbi:MAG: hypothetical protein JNL11_00610 [Bdellovibrionaceae bacterium]|nr:hypothetical protein [Pseudobdellovibrionaceae bacterium]
MKKILVPFVLMSLSGFVYASEHAAVPETDKSTVSGPVVEIRDIPTDFKIPTELWDKLMAGEGAAVTGGGHGGDKDKDKKDDVLIVWVPMEVSFLAKRPNILIHEWVQYKFPRGGGSLDLAKVTSGDKGTFYLNFNMAEFTNRPAVKVYFLSNAKKRRVDGEIYGAGCNTYFDVTSAIQKAVSGEGIRFNITDNRHISTLSGHFIFVQIEKDKVYLSQIEFSDSKNRDYLCKN